MSEIDHEAVIAQLQEENERLRLRLFTTVVAPPIELDLASMRAWIFDNYLIIAAACLIISCLAGLLEVFYGRRR